MKGDVEQLEINILKQAQELEEIREVWVNMQWHPEKTDIDSFLILLQYDPELERPYVAVVKKRRQISAIVIGQIRSTQFVWKLGYKAVHTSSIRSLEVLYGGILGKLSYSDSVLLVNKLRDGLRRGEADVVFFDHLTIGSPLFKAAQETPNFLERDHCTYKNLHWKLDIPASFDELLGKLSKNTRRDIRKTSNRVRKKYGEKLTIRCFRHSTDLDLCMTDIERVASKTYHRRLGAGFVDNDLNRRLIRHFFERQMVRSYVLYIDGRPSAFWNGLQFRETLFGISTGYDPSYRPDSIGTFLLMEIVKELCNEGEVDAIDFGFGDARFKRNYCNEVWTESCVYIFAPTWKGARFNCMRTLIVGVNQFSKTALNRFGLLQNIKTKWRQRLLTMKKNM